ncbi:hypothetical protein ES708_14924 [subsurface metagenome]
MIEQFSFHVLIPYRETGTQKIDRADYVGVDKGQGIKDGTVDVRLGGQVNNCIRAVFFKNPVNEFRVDNIALNKTIIRQVFQVCKVLQVAGVGQGIQVKDPVFRIFFHKEPDHMRTDEPCPTRY